jgi:hypothetical protein
MNDVIWAIQSAPNKKIVQFPYPNGKMKDFLEFGVSYIEQQDHIVEYIIVNTQNIRKLITEMPDFSFSVFRPYIGKLWTSKVFITDKTKDSFISFSNADFSVVLNLQI